LKAIDTYGGGMEGWPGHDPFDVINISAGTQDSERPERAGLKYNVCAQRRWYILFIMKKST